MRHLKKYYRLYLSLLAVVFISISVFRTRQADKSLEDNHAVVCGIIYEGWVTKNGNHIKYKFQFGNTIKTYTGNCSDKTMELFEHGIKKVLILVEKSDPSNNILIEKESDFQKYKIKREDTLGISVSCI